MELLKFFAILTSISTFSLVIVTALYVKETRKMVLENKRLIETLTKPIISVKYEENKRNIAMIDLVIRNIGLGLAYNIKLKIEPEFTCYLSKNEKYSLSNIALFREGLKYLASNQEVRHFLNYLGDMTKEERKTIYNGTVTYYDKLGKLYEDNFVINFSHREDLLRMKDETKIEESLRKIQEDIHSLVKNKGFPQ